MQFLTHNPLIEIKRFRSAWSIYRPEDRALSMPLMRLAALRLLMLVGLVGMSRRLLEPVASALSFMWTVWRLTYYHGHTVACYNDKFVMTTLRNKRRIFFISK